jgi:hypothetical protein
LPIDQFSSTEENAIPPVQQLDNSAELPPNAPEIALAPEEPAVVTSVEELEAIDIPDEKVDLSEISEPDLPDFSPEETMFGIAADQKVQPKIVDIPVNIEPVTVQTLHVVNSNKESAAAPQPETHGGIHSTHLSASMMAPAVQQVKVSPPLQGADPFEKPPSVYSDASMVGPAIPQVQTSPPLEAPDVESTNKDAKVQHFRPWTLPVAEKAPSVNSDSSHMAPAVRQIRTHQLEDPDARTDSSAGSIHEVPVVEPVPVTQSVEARAPAAAEAPAKAKSESGSEGSGNIVGHAPTDLPPQFSRQPEPQPQVPVFFFTNLTNM